MCVTCQLLQSLGVTFLVPFVKSMQPIPFYNYVHLISYSQRFVYVSYRCKCFQRNRHIQRVPARGTNKQTNIILAMCIGIFQYCPGRSKLRLKGACMPLYDMQTRR